MLVFLKKLPMPEESNPKPLLQAARTCLTTKTDKLLIVYLIIALITSLCYVINYTKYNKSYIYTCKCVLGLTIGKTNIYINLNIGRLRTQRNT